MRRSPEDSFLAKKLSCCARLSLAELAWLAKLQSKPMFVERGKEFIHEGQTGHKAYILHEGWCCSFKVLPCGQRQIITFPIPGDCVGLRSVMLKRSAHAIAALTDVILSPVDTSRMLRTFRDHPRLGAAILCSASWDEALVLEHLLSVGRRNALERTAHFFLELADRLSLVGLGSETEFDCPLNQYVLADALGLTAVHVNRVLRQLRERKLLTLKAGKVVITNPVALKEFAAYQGSPA